MVRELPLEIVAKCVQALLYQPEAPNSPRAYTCINHDPLFLARPLYYPDLCNVLLVNRQFRLVAHPLLLQKTFVSSRVQLEAFLRFIKEYIVAHRDATTPSVLHSLRHFVYRRSGTMWAYMHETEVERILAACPKLKSFATKGVSLEPVTRGCLTGWSPGAFYTTHPVDFAKVPECDGQIKTFSSHHSLVFTQPFTTEAIVAVTDYKNNLLYAAKSSRFIEIINGARGMQNIRDLWLDGSAAFLALLMAPILKIVPSLRSLRLCCLLGPLDFDLSIESLQHLSELNLEGALCIEDFYYHLPKTLEYLTVNLHDCDCDAYDRRKLKTYLESSDSQRLKGLKIDQGGFDDRLDNDDNRWSDLHDDICEELGEYGDFRSREMRNEAWEYYLALQSMLYNDILNMLWKRTIKTGNNAEWAFRWEGIRAPYKAEIAPKYKQTTLDTYLHPTNAMLARLRSDILDLARLEDAELTWHKYFKS